MEYLSFANRVGESQQPEIVLNLMDLSGSMESEDWTSTRKAGAIEANKEFINLKAQNYPQDKVGIIGFGTSAKILQEPICVADGTKSLYRALKSPPSMGMTNFKAALKLAETCLFSKSVPTSKSIGQKGLVGFFSELLYGPSQANQFSIKEASSKDGCLRRIILLTDGDWNKGGTPLKVANHLKDAGVIIDCIGIASKEEVKENKLKEIASRNADGTPRYCWIGSKKQLIRKYESLAHHIRPV